MQFLLEHISDGVIVSDRDTKVLYANAAASKMLGMKKGDLIGVALRELVHPEDQKMVKIFDRELVAKRRVRNIRRMRRKDGSYILAERSAMMLDEAMDISILRDVTESRELEHRKDTFISIASHELRTPVTGIRLYNEIALRLLKEDGDRTEVSNMLEKVDDQVEKLKNLIGDMLNLSKIQAGKLEFRRSSFNLDDLVHEAAVHMKSIAKRKFRITIKGAAGRKVMGDKDRIYQVVVNLLSNAMKYSPKADTIEIVIGKTATDVFVSVTDFGIGIKKEELRKIFQRFYRVPGEVEHTYTGMGIGLFLCREIIRQHGGRLMVESVHGKGSTFTFSLPLGRRAAKRK